MFYLRINPKDSKKTDSMIFVKFQISQLTYINYVSPYGDIFICWQLLLIITMNRSVTDWRAKILGTLSDPTRLEIVEFLGGEERCVCEIVPAFERAQSTISKHLNLLFEAGIVERRTEGKRTLYRVRNPKIFDLLREVDAMALDQISELKKAEEMLEASIR